MKFEVSFLWHYDPCRIISEMRVKNKNVPSVTILQTTTPQAPKEKEPRKDTSPSITEVLVEFFQLHTKRKKYSHATDTTGKREAQSTTNVKGDQSPLVTSNKNIMSTVSSKKPTDTSLVDQHSDTTKVRKDIILFKG
jgi:hypothetical protein